MRGGCMTEGGVRMDAPLMMGMENQEFLISNSSLLISHYLMTLVTVLP